MLPFLLILRREYCSLLDQSLDIPRNPQERNPQDRKSSFAFRKMSAIVLEIGELVTIIDSDRSWERILRCFSKDLSLPHFDVSSNLAWWLGERRTHKKRPQLPPKDTSHSQLLTDSRL